MRRQREPIRREYAPADANGGILTWVSLKVHAIQRFTSTASAVEDLSAVQEGKLTDAFSKFLVDATGGGAGDTDGEKKKKKKKLEETLIVSEPKLGAYKRL